ncbi:hypothetical protein AUJ78_00665 [Candidatus Peregrinibacteria bacterium CG1_02_41_10]|nr:MAG: hypothetical protein AUJ78_00665 [Candidatus Peregrinibacteria bacterium CG1_02_41_10]
MKVDNDFFQEFQYTKQQLEKFLLNARNDLKIAEHDNNPSIIYRFAYDAVIKLGVYLLAKQKLKVRSVMGHHFKILEFIAEILELKDEIDYLNRVRRQRNQDLYEGGIEFTKKEADSLLQVVQKIFTKVKS